MNRIVAIIFWLFTFSINGICENHSRMMLLPDTIWFCDTVHLSNDLIVDSSELLLIEPGSVVIAYGQYKIKIEGRIEAIGSMTDSILFTINDTTFFSDTSTTLGGWGGIEFRKSTGSDTSIFKYCRFDYGKAIDTLHGATTSSEGNLGGAIKIEAYPWIGFSNCTFFHNLAKSRGGALYALNCKSLLIDSCLFSQNESKFLGGAIYNKAPYHYETSIQNCSFIENICLRIGSNWVSGSGAGIYIDYPGLGNITISNNLFTGNLSIGGTIFDNHPYTRITNNLIANNFGASIDNGNSDSHAFYTSNTIVNNKAFINHAGIQVFSKWITIQNNILWGNLSMLNNDSTQITYYSSSPPIVAYNCIKKGFPGEGNIDQDPLFTNPSPAAGLDYPGWMYDWSLQDSSPCINRATPDTNGLILPSLDAYGNPRFFGGRLDMGAIENQHVWVNIPNPLVAAPKITVYPNPSSATLYIDIPPNFTGYHITLYDLLGKPQREAIIHTSPAIFMVSDLPPGIYCWMIAGDHDIMASGKWVKR